MKQSMIGFRYLLYQLFWESLDLLFPPQCIGCQRTGSRWCRICQEKAVKIQEPICEICGTPLTNVLEKVTVCNNCSTYKHSFHQLRSWAIYSDMTKEALLSLKYNKNMAMGEILSRPLSSLLTQLEWSIDVIIPVPISKQRLAERGYNQAAMLAYPLALHQRMDYLPKALEKVNETTSQVGLSLKERRQNVMGAFRAISHFISDKTILLIDDIATTCSTLDSCANALIESGARDVYCLTLARTLWVNQ